MSSLAGLAKKMRLAWRSAIAHKAWWIVPVVWALALVGLLTLAGRFTTPFIYTVF